MQTTKLAWIQKQTDIQKYIITTQSVNSKTQESIGHVHHEHIETRIGDPEKKEIHHSRMVRVNMIIPLCIRQIIANTLRMRTAARHIIIHRRAALMVIVSKETAQQLPLSDDLGP